MSLFLICFFTTVSEAGLLESHNKVVLVPAMHGKWSPDSQNLLNKKGFSPSQLEYYYSRRSLTPIVDRPVPSGPDPHHHGQLYPFPALTWTINAADPDLFFSFFFFLLFLWVFGERGRGIVAAVFRSADDEVGFLHGLFFQCCDSTWPIEIDHFFTIMIFKVKIFP